jgi:hypothetical protein
MVPVTVKQPAINSQYTLSLHDDDIEVNPTLDYYFNEKHNVDLPTFEKTTIDEYMNLIEGIVDKHGWRLIREVSLGLFSFMKINMHHDLQKNRKIIFKNPIIRAFAGDRQAIEPPLREDRFDEEAPKDCYQVHLADSSQQEAIQLSKKGGSFIIQGPPGTGKSQTITNIIAEALAAGKKVLFVSEKLAALEVVYKRLKEAGLDDFCLPLHSHKANKREILNEIGKNLNLKDKPIRLKNSAMTELTELFRDRGQLNKYAEELHAAIPPLGESLYEVFGKLAKAGSVPSVDFALPNPAAISADSFNNLSYSVKNYEKALKNMGCRLSENPWRGAEIIQTGADFWQNLTDNTSGLKEKLLGLNNTFAEQQKKFFFHSPPAWNRVEQTIRLFAAIKDLPLFPFELRDNAYRAEFIKKAEKGALDKAEYLKNLSETRTFFKGDIFAHDLTGWLITVDGCIKIIRSIGISFDDAYPNLLKDAELIHKEALALETELQGLEKALKETAAILRVDMDKPTFNKLSDISEIIVTFINGKPVQREWFNESSLESAERFLRSAKDHAESISKLKAGVLEKYEKEAFEIDAKAMLFRFKTEYSGFFGRLFNANYRNDKKILRSVSKNFKRNIEDTEILAVLTALKDIKAEQEWFTANKETLQTHFGEYYYGEETDLSLLENALKRAAKFLELFPNRKAPQAVIDIFAKRSEHELLKTARILSPENVRGAIARINNTFSGQFSTFEEIFPKLAELISASGRLSACIKAVTPAHIGELNLTELRDKVSTAASAQAKRDLLKVQTFFPGSTVLETDMREVLQNLSLIDALFRDREFAFVSDAFFKYMCDSREVREEIEIALEDLRDKYEITKKPLFKWTSLFEDETPFYGMDIPELIVRFSACLASALPLDGWISFKEAKAECVKAGLVDFVDKTAELPPALIYDIFCKGFYIKWVSAVIGGKESVLQFRRNAQDAKVERFIELDKKQLLIARARIREKIISGFPEKGGFTFARDEMGVLKKELGKKRAHKPLRKLFNEIPNLLSALKPCLMMSPLSVAYFLENYKFDMVIFDEASQIFPQDAIGAILRGKQLIIAGDSKQLPPTDFFLGKKGGADYDGWDGEEADDDYDGDIGESILEKAGEILDDAHLSWHYRSKHENLIAFSNQEIYNAELITFPSRITKSEENGVDFIYVEDGVYESGGKNCNVREAERCVELVKEHIDRYKTRSARSLGIIAFSEKQGQQISLAVQRFREQNSQYEDFFLEGGEDEFFVKNLENVQGDERDTIIFSVGYAKTREQKESGKPMPMRFGPLSAKGGERRLNVAITRAKRNVKLVSSILPSDLNLAHTNSVGVKMLRSYIEFAMSGKLAEHKISGFEREEDDFVSAVNGFINSCGYRTKKYLGHSDYKLDIAVEHPEKEGVYIAGIECDGIAYKKAKTARDRDHLRKSVLENMNWKLYRVWSAEWRTNVETEREKLRNFIAEAVQNFNFDEKSVENPPVNDVSYIAEESENSPTEGESGFDYYVEANLDEISGRGEEDVVRHIVNIEQPIHRNLLYQRMLGYYGLARVSSVSTQVSKIIKKKPFLIDADGFVTLEGFDKITPRIPKEGGTPRSIEHISPKELGALMLVIAAESFGLTEDGLFDAAREMLGYARKSEKILQRMREALSRLVSEGKITINNGKLSVKI